MSYVNVIVVVVRSEVSVVVKNDVVVETIVVISHEEVDVIVVYIVDVNVDVKQLVENVTDVLVVVFVYRPGSAVTLTMSERPNSSITSTKIKALR